MPIAEVTPGLHHWTARHERIGIEVSSYYLAEERVLIDPMMPAEGLDWFGSAGAPTDIVLSNRHHLRHSEEFVEAFGCVVHCQRLGLHEFEEDEPVEPFDFGDKLPGGIVAHKVGAITPEETALHLPAHRALAFADGLVRFGDEAPLGFVPDFLMDDARAVKEGLVVAFERLLQLDFDALLLAHGGPTAPKGKDALRAFVEKEMA